jgi:hypothetical protein
MIEMFLFFKDSLTFNITGGKGVIRDICGNEDSRTLPN